MKSGRVEGRAVRLLIGLDIGTSAIKGVLISEEGDVIAGSKRDVKFLYPAPGFIEFSAEAQYIALCDLIRELSSQRTGSGTIVALSMAAASGNSLLLDAEYRPLTNAISWMDERAAGRDNELIPGIDTDAIHSTAGWYWLGMFPLAHFAWLKKYRPDVYKRAEHFAMNCDYLCYRLSGVHAIDYSNATPSYLLDQERRIWNKPYLDELEITERHLPSLHPSGTAIGKITPNAAEATGLSGETLVVLGAFDHPCAARGTGTLKEGRVLLSCGTSWVGFYPSFERETGVKEHLLIDPFLSPEGPWGLMFSIPGIGLAIDRFVDALVENGRGVSVGKYDAFNEAAGRAPPGADGLMIDIIGRNEKRTDPNDILRCNTPENVSRAVMEMAAFEMWNRLLRLSEAGLPAEYMTMVGGPSESPVWPQILSDVTGLELRLADGRTAGAVGAAILAGIGAGMFPDEESGFAAMGGRVSRIRPSSAAPLYKALFDRYVEKICNRS